MTILTKLTNKIGAICTLLLIPTFFVFFTDIYTVLSDYDLYRNLNKYKKKEIIIDSIYYFTPSGYESYLTGYSKELNNYKTSIDLGMINGNDDYEIEGMDNNGEIHRYVWYRDGFERAYLAKKEEKKFPIILFFYETINSTIFWLLALVVSFVSYKISKKSELFKKANKNKNKNENDN